MGLLDDDGCGFALDVVVDVTPVVFSTRRILDGSSLQVVPEASKTEVEARRRQAAGTGTLWEQREHSLQMAPR
jgi:hypothetical protein